MKNQDPKTEEVHKRYKEDQAGLAGEMCSALIESAVESGKRAKEFVVRNGPADLKPTVRYGPMKSGDVIRASIEIFVEDHGEVRPATEDDGAPDIGPEFVQLVLNQLYDHQGPPRIIIIGVETYVTRDKALMEQSPCLGDLFDKGDPRVLEALTVIGAYRRPDGKIAHLGVNHPYHYANGTVEWEEPIIHEESTDVSGRVTDMINALFNKENN